MALIPDAAIRFSHEVSHAAFKLYACYCKHRNREPDNPAFGLAWPDRETIHDQTGIFTTYVSTLKRELAMKGWIEVIGSKVRPLKGFDLPAEESNDSIIESNYPTFAPEQGSNNPTPESNHSTVESNNPTPESNHSTRIYKVLEPVQEPPQEPVHEPPQAPPPRGAAGGRKEGAQERATRLPPDFALTGEMREWARGQTPLVPVEFHFEEFCDYWRSLPPGKRSMKTDWLMAWKNRMRRLQSDAVREQQRGQRYVEARAAAQSRVGRSMGAVEARLAELEEKKRAGTTGRT